MILLTVAIKSTEKLTQVDLAKPHTDVALRKKKHNNQGINTNQLYLKSTIAQVLSLKIVLISFRTSNLLDYLEVPDPSNYQLEKWKYRHNAVKAKSTAE